MQKGGTDSVDDYFSDLILPVRVDNNHSKIFLTDSKAFIGSANFSCGSNNNFECGFFTENKEIINEIRKKVFNECIWRYLDLSIQSTPRINDPLSKIQDIETGFKETLKILTDKDKESGSFSIMRSELHVLYKTLLSIQFPFEYDDLLRYYFELEDYKNCYSLEHFEVFKDLDKDYLIYTVEELIRFIEQLKRDIILYYEKYGKYSTLI